MVAIHSRGDAGGRQIEMRGAGDVSGADEGSSRDGPSLRTRVYADQTERRLHIEFIKARPREPKTATVERREASVLRHGTQGASQAPDTPRYGVPHGCSAEHPNVFRRFVAAPSPLAGERSSVLPHSMMG